MLAFIHTLKLDGERVTVGVLLTVTVPVSLTKPQPDWLVTET